MHIHTYTHTQHKRTVTHTHTHNTYITHINIKHVQLRSKHACANSLLEQCSRKTL